MSEELKPCPFCGGPASEAMWPGHVGCLNSDCGAYKANLSIAAWNRRASPTTEGREKAMEDAQRIVDWADNGKLADDEWLVERNETAIIAICRALLSSPRVEEIEAAMLEYMVANNVGGSVLEILTAGSPYLRIPRDVLRDALASALSLPDGEGDKQATRAEDGGRNGAL